MTGYGEQTEGQTVSNSYFRQVMSTGKYAQLVSMCLQPGQELGNEVHHHLDQFFRIEEGKARFVLNGKEEHDVADGDAVIVPAGTYHTIINNSKNNSLRLYTLCSPTNQGDSIPEDMKKSD